ncbi:hypothetical protein ACQPW3_11890 [Actinosynnema sp. CA-248983]
MRVVLTVVIALLALASCTGSAPDDVDERFVVPGKPRTSPSGNFTAHVEVGDDKTARLVSISDAKDVEVFRDDLVYRVGNAGRLTVVWLSTADQLWILSTDIGTRYVNRDASTGTWTVDYPADRKDVPQEIKDLERIPGKTTR